MSYDARMQLNVVFHSKEMVAAAKTLADKINDALAEHPESPQIKAVYGAMLALADSVERSLEVKAYDRALTGSARAF